MHRFQFSTFFVEITTIIVRADVFRRLPGAHFAHLGCVQITSMLSGLIGNRGLSQERGVMKVRILQWHAVASWTWDAHDDACGICRMAFDGCCPDCKMPGDDCPLMWGACNHAFHLHCILKWVNSQSPRPQCPMCRRDWKFRAD